MAKHSIELDFYYAGPRPVSTTEVEIALVKEEGPAGGNPLYKLTGTLNSLKAWLEKNYCNESSDPADFYLSFAKAA